MDSLTAFSKKLLLVLSLPLSKERGCFWSDSCPGLISSTEKRQGQSKKYTEKRNLKLST